MSDLTGTWVNRFGKRAEVMHEKKRNRVYIFWGKYSTVHSVETFSRQGWARILAKDGA